jgi:GrpB-like predicted nucleotidyltransferase (UPF0157 family)
MDLAPERFPVELVPHSPDWADIAAWESARLAAAMGGCAVVIHHIGSTSIPGILAKPTIDLMPMVTSHAALEAREPVLRALGYDWRGEFGIPGRRFLTMLAGEPRRRVFNVHCFEDASGEAARHLAFRDYMRAHPDRAKAYEAEKLRAKAAQPGDTLAYSQEKGAWVKAAEAKAVAWYSRR